MNKDVDERLLPPGQMRTLINGRVSTSEGSDAGAIENCLGNEVLTSLTLGNNATTIGVGSDISLNIILWLTKSDDRCCLIEYDVSNDTATKVLEDTRTGSNRILNLSEDYPVNKISIIVDTDNDNVYATWTDNNDPVRFVNIDRAKSYGTNGFGQDEISLIKKPPIHRPEITLQNASVSEENHLEELFLRFSYRYKYLDGELSAPSPFSKVAFEAKPFNYNFSTNTNESMVNRYNEVEVEFDTGSDLVKEVEILVREDLSNLLVVVETYNKSDESWADNTNETITYSRKKIKNVLGVDQISRLFDAVPHKAGELEVIGSEIVLGNITEEFNIVNLAEDRIPLDFSLDYNTTAITAPGSAQSVKTIRDYTAALVYIDEYGRATAALTYKDGEVFVKGSDMVSQCLLELTIKHLPPPFAVGYRVFIKQSRDDYDIITPPLFYRDGVYAWLKLESGEQDKINEGDYLIVKADTQGVKDSYIETRVLEITTKERNFLEGDQTITTIEQVPGLYFKIKVGNNFRIAPEDFVLYEWYAFDNISGGIDNPIIGAIANVVEPAVYYGSIGLDDMTTGGTYTDTANDRRYIVEITATGAMDTFRWSDDNGWSWTSGVTITGVAQALSNGVTVTFGAVTGHDVTDQWKFSAHGSTTDSIGSFEGNQTYTIIQGPNDPEDDTIYANASITLVVLQRRDGQPDIRVEHTLTASTTYANIEEWYWGDNVATTIDAATNFDAVWFRRGNATGGTSGNNGFEQDAGGLMCMIIRGQYTVNPNSGFATTEVDFSVFQNEDLMLFETKSVENQAEQYWEASPTYLISGGYHQGNGGSDTNQSSGVDAVLNLDFFNCFSWGNGFESYKIKDSLTGNKMSFYTRSLASQDDYGLNVRKSSFTWGRHLEQSTNFNGLNEFNRALNNSMDLDDAKGSIQRMFNRDTDLFIAQEHRLQPVGFRKTQIFDQSGNPSIVKSDSEFSIFRAYAGEYGISQDPQSFAFFGYRLYMSDRKRGTPLRLSIDGVTEISMHGMSDYFKDLYRENEDAKIIGGYDPYFDEYLLAVIKTSGTSYTIGFSEQNKGWVSLYSYVPEEILGLNNRLYTWKNGQLYLHNSEVSPRNNFYGIQYNTEVEVIFNDLPTRDKILKSIILDSNVAWDVEIESSLATISTIADHEFVDKGSKFYGYVRGNESSSDLSASNVHGTGNIGAVDGLGIRVPSVNQYASTGDQVWQVNSGVPELLGTIDSISGNIINLVSIIATPIVGNFCYIKKNSRIDGGKMKGYYFKVKLTSDSEEFAELYAVQAEIVKSYVE